MWPFRRSLEKILGESDSRRVFNELFDRLPAKGELTSLQQGIFDLWWLFAEVANGTVDQFLGNSAGDSYYRVIDFLEKVGAGEALLTLRKVEQIFPDGVVPSNRGERLASLSAWHERVSEAEGEMFIREISSDLLKSYRTVISRAIDLVRANVAEYEHF